MHIVFNNKYNQTEHGCCVNAVDTLDTCFRHFPGFNYINNLIY